MTTVDIEYCVPCGHLDRAVQTQRALLETFGQGLDGVQLTTGDGGVFKIRVDGELVWDTDEDGYDLESIVETVDSRVGSEA
ncbi:MAG: SelT/SelW/SelH family protein [Halobacteriales archaeon]